MERNSQAAIALGLVCLLILFLPLVLTLNAVLFWGQGLAFEIQIIEVWFALRTTLVVGLASAMGGFFLGLLLFAGWLGRPSFLSESDWLIWLFVAPFFFPPLISIGQFLNVFSALPQGAGSLILYHSLLLAGFFLWWFSLRWQERLGKAYQLAATLGASSSLQFWVFWSGIKKDVPTLFVFASGAAATGLAAALSLGGGKVFTLEVFTFELVKIGFQLPLAMVVSLLQSLVLIAASVWFSRQTLPILRRRSTGQVSSIDYWPLQLAFLLLPIFLWIFYFSGFPFLEKAIEQLQSLPAFWANWWSSAVKSLLLASIVSGLGFLLCLALFVVSPVVVTMSSWLWGLGMLSGVLLIMGIFVIDELLLWPFYILVLNTMFFPFLFRFFFAAELPKWKAIMDWGSSMGASPHQTVLLVFLKSYRLRVLALVTLLWSWTLGEFVLIRLLAANQSTWGLIVDSLLSGFYFEAGVLVNSLFASIMLLPVLAYFFLQRLNKRWLKLKT